MYDDWIPPISIELVYNKLNLLKQRHHTFGNVVELFIFIVKNKRTFIL